MEIRRLEEMVFEGFDATHTVVYLALFLYAAWIWQTSHPVITYLPPDNHPKISSSPSPYKFNYAATLSYENTFTTASGTTTTTTLPPPYTGVVS